MMLKISSRSINPFWRMFTFTLRKSLGLIIVLCAAALMYCPGSYISIILDTMRDVNSVGYTEIFATVIAFFGGAVVVGFNVINFTFLYKKSAGDVFHAFPLTRCELLLSRAFAGFVSTVIPMTVAYIAFSILTAFNSWLGDFTQIPVYFAHTLLIFLVCSAFSLIFVVCAGSMFDLGVSLIGVNLAVMLIGNIFTHTLSSTLIGYSDNYTAPILYNLSIPYFCYRGLDDTRMLFDIGMNESVIEFYIRSVIYIIAFGATAVLLYNYRKAEKGGTAYAYKFMYLICSMLAGICGGYIIGMMFGYEPFEIIYWIFMGLGAVLCSTVYGVVSNRGFKQVWRSVTMGGIALAVMASVAAIGVTGGFGYVNRVPEIQSVEKTWVRFRSEYVEFDDPKLVIALHNDIVDKNAAKATDDHWDNYIVFEYLLKNGKTMTRNFYVETDSIVDAFLKVYTDTARINKHIETVKADKFGFIMLNFDRREDYGTVTINKDEAIGFLEAYKKDLANYDKSILTDDWKYRYEFSGNDLSSNNDDHYYFDLEVYSGFTNTEQYIIDSGILE